MSLFDRIPGYRLNFSRNHQKNHDAACRAAPQTLLPAAIKKASDAMGKKIEVVE